MSVEYNGTTIHTKLHNGSKALDLKNKNISHISQIKGLDRIIDLEILNLSGNQIEEIKDLQFLVNLESLNLYDNQIRKIRG